MREAGFAGPSVPVKTCRFFGSWDARLFALMHTLVLLARDFKALNIRKVEGGTQVLGNFESQC